MDNENITVTGVVGIRMPKEIAKITVCGALTFTITDMMAFTSPTEEQRKNLKDMFCIDVEILD